MARINEFYLLRDTDLSTTSSFAVMRTVFVLALAAVCSFLVKGADPTATLYSPDDCQGSLKPYPEPEAVVEHPDTLTPVFINHVGRHGARFPSSSKNAEKLMEVLSKGEQEGTLTPLGSDLKKLTEFVIERSHNRWGALDSLGMAEQRGIASRMFRGYPELFRDGTVNAISSYSPRAMMSMYEFVHQLDRLNNHNDFITSTGRQNSILLRPFDLDADYKEWKESKAWEEPYRMQMETASPVSAVRRLFKTSTMSNEEAVDVAMAEYFIVAGMSAMGNDIDMMKYFTAEELNAAWSVFNLRQYLQWSATTLSSAPADLASALIVDLLTTTDAAIEGTATANVMLRFGHAETLMPLLSLMRLRGAYYLTNYFDTVALHWRDFYLVPMASNLQMILFRSTKGNYYVRFDLNEVPVPLLPNSDEIYLPYGEVRDYLNRCLPIHMKI